MVHRPLSVAKMAELDECRFMLMGWGGCAVNYMKMVEFVGLSGPIKFDASGLRTQFVLSLMELQMPGLVRRYI